MLVQWQGCAPEEANWELFDEFCSTYPAFHLEDKVIFEGGETDTAISLPRDQLHNPPVAITVEAQEDKAEVASKEPK